MSGKDLAGDKLIASIKKTKQAVQGSNAPASDGNQPQTAKAEAVKPPVKKAVSKKTVKKKASKPKAATAKKASRNADSNKKPLIGLFNRGRRVWPD